MTLEEQISDIWYAHTIATKRSDEAARIETRMMMKWTKKDAELDFRLERQAIKFKSKILKIKQLIKTRIVEGLISPSPYIRRMAELMGQENVIS